MAKKNAEKTPPDLSGITDHIISEAEKFEIERKIIKEQILNHGITFNIDRKSFFDFPNFKLIKFLKSVKGKSKRGCKLWQIKITSPYLSTMDQLAAVKLELQVNMQALDENPIAHKNTIVKDNAYLMAKIVALSILNNNNLIEKYGEIFSDFIYKRIDSEILANIVGAINILEDAANFISSTELMSGSIRTTQPKTEEIEKNPLIKVVKQSA